MSDFLELKNLSIFKNKSAVKGNNNENVKNNNKLKTQRTKSLEKVNKLKKTAIEKNKTTETNNLLSTLKDISTDVVFDTKKYFAKTIQNFYNRDQCFCESNLKKYQTCKRAINWLRILDNKDIDFDYLKNQYEKISRVSLVDEKNINQIHKDSIRTFPKSKFFQKIDDGNAILERILINFSKYDPKIGYVQGMNFIAASLLYHSEEYIAFWLLAMILEHFELRDIYLPSKIFI